MIKYKINENVNEWFKPQQEICKQLNVDASRFSRMLSGKCWITEDQLKWFEKHAGFAINTIAAKFNDSFQTPSSGTPSP